VRDEGWRIRRWANRQNLFAYGKPDIFDLAASYAFGLVKNHPFIDGNKRTGFVVAVVFLELNGYRFHASEVDANRANACARRRRNDRSRLPPRG